MSESRYRQEHPLLVFFQKWGGQLCLFALSIVFSWLSFPNYFFTKGLFPLAFLAPVPLFVLIHKAPRAVIPVYGGVFGFFYYRALNYWLANFHPYAMLLVSLIHVVYYLLFFPFLKWLDSCFPRWGVLLQSFAWVIFEYLGTLGFLGYSYGVTGYTQYPFLPLIGISDITGVWGVSWLIVFPAALLAWCLRDGPSAFLVRLNTRRRTWWAYGLILFLVLLYGIAGKVPVAGLETKRMSLIQQNVDPWKGGYNAYARSLDISLRLSRQALQEKPDLVVWSETAFVPAVEYHSLYRENPDAYELVEDLLVYLAGKETPFVIGNDHGERIRKGTPGERRVDYNAALLFHGDEISGIYRKIHLVPFVEHFPYQKWFPRFHRMLLEADTHFWEKGAEYTVFEAAGIRFATPICFEDTFGGLCAAFVRRGADVLVNLTNDSWSKSVVAEEQHMIMAVYRAVENRRSLVRSTNGGITCAIDPNGRVLDRLEPFTEDYLNVDLPVYGERKTLYTRWGDWFPVALSVVLGGVLLIRAGLSLRRKYRGKY